jgi:hypothetical protein
MWLRVSYKKKIEKNFASEDMSRIRGTDPHQNVTNLQHCLFYVFFLYVNPIRPRMEKNKANYSTGFEAEAVNKKANKNKKYP